MPSSIRYLTRNLHTTLSLGERFLTMRACCPDFNLVIAYADEELAEDFSFDFLKDLSTFSLWMLSRIVYFAT